MDMLETIEAIQHDFEERHAPFDAVEFPEERLLREFDCTSGEWKMRFLSAFAMLDYNRNAAQLVDNLIELGEYSETWFDPCLSCNSEETLAELFAEIGFRYPNRDAAAWSKNMSIIDETYHGEWVELLLDVDLDATALIERLRSDGFSCLKGEKIAPMYARFVDQYVVSMDNLWELDIPVDTWVRKITQEIARKDMSDDEIRNWWRNIANNTDIERHIIDGGIWLIGNNLNDWGENYLKDLLDIETFKYL